MFRILTSADYQTSLWKNGGGITHEIARDVAGDAWSWRISIAEVASDGPFSLFEGKSRILTVIEGEGVDLFSPIGVLEALYCQPVNFSGDLEITSKMVAGPIRDLNLIFDATQISATVQVFTGPDHIAAHAVTVGFLCLSGPVLVDGQAMPVGAFAIGAGGDITLNKGGLGILVTLNDLA